MINFISQQFTNLIVYIFNSKPGKWLTSFITRIALKVFCTLFVINFSLSWLPVLFTPKISHFFEYCKFSMLSFTLDIHHEHTEENISISRVVLDSAIIYILFTIAYYGLLTPILFFNLISIACSLIHLKCNIDILLSCFSSYHSIISTYMDPRQGNIKISTDDLIISSVTLFLAGLEFVINITMLGSIYFDTMKYAFKQLSSPTIHTLSKFIGIVCFCSRTCDHIKLTNYQTYTSFVSKNFSNPFKILKKFNIFTTNEDTEKATPNVFTKI